LFGSASGSLRKELGKEFVDQTFGLIGELILDEMVRAVDLANKQAAKGLIGTGQGAKGSRAHKLLQDLVRDASEKFASDFKRFGLEIEAEVFLDKSKQPVRRNIRPSGSLGLDVIVKRNGKKILAFDLKTGRGLGSKEIKRRRSRFDGISIVEIFVNKK